MKNSLLLLTLLAGGISAWGQSPSRTQSLHHIQPQGLKQKATLAGTPEKTLLCRDTIRYPQAKEQILGTNNFYTFDLWKADGESMAQTFLNSGSVSIGGLEFFGANNNVDGTASVTVTAAIYSVSATNVPTTLLGSGTTTFSSATAGYHYVSFTPVTVTGNYAVVITTTSANGVLTMYVNDAAPGQSYDEDFARVKSNYYTGSAGAWVSVPNLGIGNYNFEGLIAPIVSYTMNTSFTASPTSVCLGSPVTFTNTTTPADVFTNRMYDYQQFRVYFGTAASDSTFVYDMDNTVNVWSSNQTYTYAAAGSYDVALITLGGFWGSCTDISPVTTITVNAVDNATFAYSSNTLCAGGGNETPTVNAAGTFSATPAGLSFVSTSTGELDISASTQGTYSVTYTTSGICPANTTQNLTITTAPDASFSYAAAAYCTAATDPSPTFGAGASAGTFSSTTGLSLNSATGALDLSASTPGAYTITNTIAAAGVCPATSETYDVTINATPTATVSGGGQLCGTGTIPVTVTLTGTGPWDFTFTDGTTPTTITAQVSPTYTIGAAANGTYTVTAVSTAACAASGTGSATVTFNANPTVTLAPLPAVCDNETQVSLSGAGAPAGGTYSGTGVSGIFFDPSTAGAGSETITYSYTDANGCSATATGTIVVNASPSVSLAPVGTVCVYDNAVTLAGTPAGGTYGGTGVTGSSFDPATAGTGTFVVTYDYTDANGCLAGAEESIVVDGCLGLNEMNESNLVISPNPATDMITIAYTNAGQNAVQLSLTSGDGKIVAHRTIQGSTVFSEQFNVSALANGMYFVQVKTGNETVTQKVVVQ